MAATLNKTYTSGQYSRYTLTLDNGANYKNIHVFQTKPATQSIAPAVSKTQAEISNMNPSTVSAAKVIAKTNAGMFDKSNKEFYGIYYAGSGADIYVDGLPYKTVSEIDETLTNAFGYPRYWPSFCVKKDGTATIRWFNSKAKLQAAIPYCKCIIASVQPVVFNSMDVFESKVYDHETPSYLICNKDDQNASQRFEFVGLPFTNKERTLLGHIKGSNGAYVMVCSAGLTIPNAAKVMKLLNCDYAVAMDGGSPSQMRIKEGYGANGQVTSGNPDKNFAAVCAHLV